LSKTIVVLVLKGLFLLLTAEAAKNVYIYGYVKQMLDILTYSTQVPYKEKPRVILIVIN
jgi:hypothetical protein